MRFKDEKGKLIKSIVLMLCILCVAMVIMAVRFADAKYVLTRSYETELYFYEYRIKETEIVLSTEKYTGEDITVEIKTQIPGLSIQYQLGDDGEWIDYVGPFSVSENVKLNTRLVSDEDGFISPVTSKEIKNIAVAKIGDEYFKTLAAAIDACAENAGDNKTKIEMLINVKENIVIPEGKNIELDLCGTTLQGKDSNDATITVSGKFTLIDSAQNEDGTLQGNGKLLSAGAEAVHVLENGEFVLGTNESATGANEEISITNPVIEGKTYGVKVEDNGNFKFYDGIIIGADDKSVSGEATETPTGYRVVNGTKKIDGTTYETSYLDNTYYVTFDENYENAKTSKKDIKYNTAIGELSEPTREKYIFDGWYTAKTGGEKITKDTVITKDTTFYAHWLEVVASTTIGDVTTNYASVQQAIDAAGTNPGATVTLLKDEIAETVTVAAGQNIVIDLNGKTWTNKGSQTITNNGKLIMQGDGKVIGTGSATSYTIKNNGTFEKYGQGVIEYDNIANYGIRNAGVAKLYEGKIISGRIGVDNKDGAELLIEGITIEAEEAAVSISGKALVHIVDGTIKAQTYAIHIANAEGTVIIGTNEESPIVSTTSPVIIGDSAGVHNWKEGIVKIYDGIIMGETERSIMGSIAEIPDGYTIVKGSETIDGVEYETSYLKQQYTITYNSNGEETPPATQYKIHDEDLTLASDVLTRDYYVFKGWATTKDATAVEYKPGATYTKNEKATLYAVWVDATASTTVGEKTTYYETVQQAIDAAGTNAGATVTLLKDEIVESVTVAAGQDIEIDLNGKTWTNKGSQTITNNGKLIMQGDGKVIAAGSSAAYTIVNNGTFEKYGKGIIEYNNKGNYALRNTGIAKLFEGQIISGRIGIENKESAKLLVDGITIDAQEYGIRNISTRNSVEEPAVKILSGEIISESSNTIRNESVGLIYIAGGKVISNNGNTLRNEGNGLVHILGGEIISNNSNAVYNVNQGTIQILGGIVKAADYAVSMLTAEGTLTIGTNEENLQVSTTSPTIIGGSIGVNNNAIFNFYDGIIMGPTDRSIIGEVTEIPDGYYIKNGTETIDGVTYETAYLDNTYYVTFNENYDNAPTTTKDIKYGAAIGQLPTPTRENYVFKGWYTAQTDGEKITKDTIITADTTYYAHWEEAVASTTIEGKTSYYTTIKRAIEVAGTNAGAIVTLLKDEITDSVTVDAGQDIVIDLNGKTWTNYGSEPTIINNGTLIMQGDGKVIATGSATSYAFVNNGTFEKYGNGIIEYDNNANYALRNSGVAKLYEGKIISGRIGIENKESAKVLIDGITIEAQERTSHKKYFNV